MSVVDYANIPETRSVAEKSLHRVLIVGGGAGGLELATRLGDTLGKREKASISLLDKTRTHVWKPHLHEVASGTLDSDVDSVEYLAHARVHQYRFRIGAMCGLNRDKRQIYVEATPDEEGHELIPRRVLGYDTLVIAVGSMGNDFGTPGVKEHAIAIDSAEEAARFNRRMTSACIRANAQYEPLRPGQLHCAIVGAGATGVELAAELHKSMRDIASYNLDNIDFDKLIRITLIEAGPRILPALPQHLADSTEKLLRDLRVDIRCGVGVTEATADGVRLADGSFLPAELVVWAAGIKAPEFLKGLDALETDRINRLVVNDKLQTTRDNDIFAVGDCANCVLPGSDKPLPPRAQTAHQQATHMVKIVNARLKNQPLPAFRYHDFGSLVSLADYRTFGNVAGGLKIEGLIARVMYRSLYKMHLLAVHGSAKTFFDTVAQVITRHTEPRIKLH